MLPVRAVEPHEATENASSEAAAERHQDHAVSSVPSLRGIRALVVDDQSDARELVAAVLRDAGAYVIEASSAAEAMAALSMADATVLVADIGMPLNDGCSLVRAVRSNAATRGLPALALTAYARAEDRAKAIAAGFDDHAAKPVDPDDLVRRVAALARHGDLRR
jgi:CheY-like chemotaxis protein